MLSYLSSLHISVLRSLNTETNKFYVRTNRLYDAALFTRCYTQHALRPVIESKINHIRHFIKSKKETPQKLTQLSSRSHPKHLVGKRTAQKDTIIDTTSDSQVNSNFPYRWSPAGLTFNNYLYLFLYLYIT